MIRRLFLDHPASVGESYTEHCGVAARFGVAMIAGGLAGLVHAVLPFAFRTTGSRTVMRLHRQIVDQRAARAADEAPRQSVDYVI